MLVNSDKKNLTNVTAEDNDAVAVSMDHIADINERVANNLRQVLVHHVSDLSKMFGMNIALQAVFVVPTVVDLVITVNVILDTGEDFVYFIDTD